jgi:hypothetical protein
VGTARLDGHNGALVVDETCGLLAIFLPAPNVAFVVSRDPQHRPAVVLRVDQGAACYFPHFAEVLDQTVLPHLGSALQSQLHDLFLRHYRHCAVFVGVEVLDGERDFGDLGRVQSRRSIQGGRALRQPDANGRGRQSAASYCRGVRLNCCCRRRPWHVSVLSAGW